MPARTIYYGVSSSNKRTKYGVSSFYLYKISFETSQPFSKIRKSPDSKLSPSNYSKLYIDLWSLYQSWSCTTSLQSHSTGSSPSTACNHLDFPALSIYQILRARCLSAQCPQQWCQCCNGTINLWPS